jgi:predicted glycosyltransferase
MASEAAMLGTPAIYAQGSFRGYTEEEEKKYGLVYNFHNPKDFRGKAIDKACEILENDNSKREWGFKRDKMLSEKIDVTEFIVNTLMSKIT